jgi:hypothetical protein
MQKGQMAEHLISGKPFQKSPEGNTVKRFLSYISLQIVDSELLKTSHSKNCLTLIYSTHRREI